MNAKPIGGIQYVYPSNSARRSFSMLSRLPTVEKEKGTHSSFVKLSPPTADPDQAIQKGNTLMQYSKSTQVHS